MTVVRYAGDDAPLFHFFPDTSAQVREGIKFLYLVMEKICESRIRNHKSRRMF